ncbi:hypothetical protein V6R21_09625 [Limibacter armeniacum]|uniref:hypothetical protein n=1 Tax=Limibacter armeniacum TaxID=466084 RepID=UPI002FE5DD92
MLSTASAQNTPAYLKSPSDWKFERLDFPLAFAPDLGYQGYEEIRFAPGMFDRTSEMYFTYMFVLALDGRNKMDEVVLCQLLEKYYKGLCRAVAEEKQLDINLDEVTVQVAQHGKESFGAVVDLFDVFGNGKKMQVSMDISLCLPQNNQQTLLIALASAQPKQSKAWEKLAQERDRMVL